MKNVILSTAIILITINLSAQQLAAKKQKRNFTNSEINNHPIFKNYILSVNEKITYNDKTVSDLQFILMKEETKSNKKLIAKVKSLIIENDELKNDLRNFLNYGSGDFKLFIEEFSSDMLLFTNDLKALQNDFVHEELLAVNFQH